MGRKQRRLVIVFDDSSPGAKKFATAVKDLTQQTYEDDFHIYVDFSVPKDCTWTQISPAPKIDVDQPV